MLTLMLIAIFVRDLPLPPAIIGHEPRTVLVLSLIHIYVGKSTVFNALTGLRQHTGNWPGKTCLLYTSRCV